VHLAFYAQLLPTQHRIIGSHPREHLRNGITLADIHPMGSAGFTSAVGNLHASRQASQRVGRLQARTHHFQCGVASGLQQRTACEEGASPRGRRISLGAADNRGRQAAHQTPMSIEEAQPARDSFAILGDANNVAVRLPR